MQLSVVRILLQKLKQNQGLESTAVKGKQEGLDTLSQLTGLLKHQLQTFSVSVIVRKRWSKT